MHQASSILVPLRRFQRPSGPTPSWERQMGRPGARGPRFRQRRSSEAELIQSSALNPSQRSTEDLRKEVKDGEGGERLIGPLA